MILITSASSDTYITNKIIDSTLMVSGNVGRAGTLDLFKLYDESSAITGSTELSRILIKFDLGKANLLASSSLNISDSTFSAKIKLSNLSTGKPVPNNFTVEVFPLAVSFSEGVGRDVISFADVDSANFVSSSVNVPWKTSGAYKSGTLGAANLDFYASGNLSDGDGLVNLGSRQTFQLGTEDLYVDVTKIVSATIAGQIADNGFRISFTDSQELDSVTRFVKRFASRHVTDQSIRPALVISYDDSVIDHHSSSFFDLTSSLSLYNLVRGEYRNFVSGSSLTQITGSNCLLVKFSTGSYTKYVTGSQLSYKSSPSGVYSASVAFFSSDTSVISGSTTIKSALSTLGSITFDEVWTSLDKTVTFLSSSLKVDRTQGTTASSTNRKLRVSMLSTQTSIRKGENLKIRTSFYNDYEQNRSSKFAFEPSQLIVAECRIRLRNSITGKLLFDFTESGSLMSSDALSNYYTLYTDALPVGIPLGVEFEIAVDGEVLEIPVNSFKIVVSE